jgi:hypothetical protein
MIRPKNDSAAHAREDAFLGHLVPQTTEPLAERRSGDFDAVAGQARFEAWLAAHIKEPAVSTPPARVPARRPARTPWIRRFLIWLSGASQQILAECPTERPKYTGLGASVLTSAALAGVSLAFALTTALNITLWVALPLAVAWGAAILSLNRLFVVSLSRSGRPRMQFVQAIPRLLMALILGFVISAPLVLQIFRPEIEHEIPIVQSQAAAQYFRDLPSSPLQQQINRDQARVAALTREADGNGLQNAQLKALQAELSQAQAQQNADYARWQCQLYGKSPDGQQICSPAGNGSLARAAEAAYQDATAKVTELHAKIEYETSVVQNNQASYAQALTAANALPTAQTALKAEQAEQARQISTFNTQNKSSTGLLTRLQALNQAAAGNSTLSTVRWLLFALFVIIDLMPVTIKVMLNLGPKSNYDLMLEEEEKLQLRFAAHNRALRLRTQMMGDEAEQAAEQAMLTAG